MGTTRSPTFTRVTFGPTSMTSPNDSWPMTSCSEPDGGVPAAYRDPAAAALFRQAGVLLTADGPPAATPPYQKSSRPAAGL